MPIFTVRLTSLAVRRARQPYNHNIILSCKISVQKYNNIVRKNRSLLCMFLVIVLGCFFGGGGGGGGHYGGVQ